MTSAVIDMGSALAEILSRGEDAAAIQDQVRQVGGCEQPIRLCGRIDTLDRQTGELEPYWSSEGCLTGSYTPGATTGAHHAASPAHGSTKAAPGS